MTRENAEMWGATLLAENRKSANYHDGEDELERSYVFTEYSGPFSPAAILKTVACMRYESCERPGWIESEAYDFLGALEYKMIRSLPGYADAQFHVTDVQQVRG